MWMCDQRQRKKTTIILFTSSKVTYDCLSFLFYTANHIHQNEYRYGLSNASIQWLHISCPFVFLLFKNVKELLKTMKCDCWYATNEGVIYTESFPLVTRLVSVYDAHRILLNQLLRLKWSSGKKCSYILTNSEMINIISDKVLIF